MPIPSMRTSLSFPVLLGTKSWCTSSEIPYKSVQPAARMSCWVSVNFLPRDK